MSLYRFFFSYASETHRASSWNNFGDAGNHLEDFFNALCNHVALETGQPIDAVGYRDQNRLTLASFWSKDLVAALQRSCVLVSIISPHYLQSENCGREVEFFRQRFQLLNDHQPHRIIPIFWIDSITSKTHMARLVEDFFFDLQLREAGMPPAYPHTGLYKLYNLGDQVARNGLIDVVAKAILRLNKLPTLPELPGPHEFTNLPSFFSDASKGATRQVAVGPKGTNVVYAVGTRDEVAQHGSRNLDVYDTARQRWRAFGDAPGATIEAATREGLISVGQSDQDYRNLDFPSDLNGQLRAARAANSPVLIVLDRNSLRVPAIKTGLGDYDERDYRHVGLVTGGGSASDEPLVAQVLPTKYGERRLNHLWDLPDARSSYVQGVGDVISGIKRGLQQLGRTATPQPAGQLPGI
jgi:hypothetical protein